jgi:hypothetical protein
VEKIKLFNNEILLFLVVEKQKLYQLLIDNFHYFLIFHYIYVFKTAGFACFFDNSKIFLRNFLCINIKFSTLNLLQIDGMCHLTCHK